MSDTVQDYQVNFKVDKALAAINKLKTRSAKLNKAQEGALKRQISLTQKLINLQNTLSKGGGGSVSGTSITSTPKNLTSSSKDAHVVAFQKEQQQIRKLSERELNKQKKASAKQSTATFKESIKNLTPKLESGKASKSVFADMLRDEENNSFKSGSANAQVLAFQKEQVRLQREADRLEKQRVQKLKTAANTLKRSIFYQDSGLKTELNTAIASSKTADELRNQVALSRKRYREQKLTEKSLERQSYLMRRMSSSSEQFAGNMVSAFAAASGFAGIVKVGQDFESVNSTMLAVSGSTENAAEDFKFAQDQAFRLGLGLKDSAKQYAKMIAAQGELSKSDLNESFLGIAEMSTVLGLSADESGRAFTALTQIMSKNQVMAEELKGQLGKQRYIYT